MKGDKIKTNKNTKNEIKKVIEIDFLNPLSKCLFFILLKIGSKTCEKEIKGIIAATRLNAAL